MVAQQKRAWFMLVVVAVALVLFVVGGLAVNWKAAHAAFALLGLLGFQGMFGRGEKLDERDVSIARRAVAIGGMASYATFIAGCMGVFFVASYWHHQEQISVNILPSITFAGWVVLSFMYSVVILVSYSRHVEADNA